jgi:hypothetical protein
MQRKGIKDVSALKLDCVNTNVYTNESVGVRRNTPKTTRPDLSAKLRCGQKRKIVKEAFNMGQLRVRLMMKREEEPNGFWGVFCFAALPIPFWERLERTPKRGTAEPRARLGTVSADFPSLRITRMKLHCSI